MGNLVNALGDAIGADRITIGARDIVLVPDSGRWRVEYTDAGGNACCIRCAKVVTTCGAYSLPALLPFVDKERMKAVNNLYYAPIVQVGVGVAGPEGTGVVHTGVAELAGTVLGSTDLLVGDRAAIRRQAVTAALAVMVRVRAGHIG